eukprot:4450758-Amphidinium_carterae.1
MENPKPLNIAADTERLSQQHLHLRLQTAKTRVVDKTQIALEEVNKTGRIARDSCASPSSQTTRAPPR